jgi:hypothetical protein
MADQEKGISCRACGCRHFFVVKTGPAPRGRIMRKRECRNCGQMLVTYEQAAGEAKREPLRMEDLSASQRETLLRKLLGLIGIG